MVSGNDIISYNGNAAQGANDAGGIPFLGGFNTDHINNVMDDMSRQNMMWNSQMFQQKINDRNAMNDLLAQQDMNVDLLDQDRPVLQAKLNEMQKLYIDNPDMLNNPAVYAQMQKKVKEFQAMRSNGKTRYLQVADMKKQMAENTDARFRQQMASHINEQVALGINHLPDPYMKIQDWTKDIEANPPVVALGSPTTYRGKDGNYYTRTVMGNRLEDFFKYYDPFNLIEGENKNLPDQIGAFYDWAGRDERFMGDQNLNAINAKMDAINAARGAKVGDPMYLRHIAEKGEDGKWALTSNAVEMVRALSIFKNYDQKVSEALSKDAAQQAVFRSQIVNNLASAGAHRAAAGLSNAKARAENELLPYRKNLFAAQAKAFEDKGDIAEAKVVKEREEVAKPVSDAVNAFDQADQLKNYRPATQIFNKMPTPAAEALRLNLGIDDNWQFSSVPMTNSAAVKMLSVPVQTKGKKQVAKAPVVIYALKGPDGQIKMVGLDKNGNFQKSTDLSQGVNELISYENGYDSKRKVELESKAKRYINYLQGGDYMDMSLDRIRNHVANPQSGVSGQSIGTPGTSSVDEVREIEGKQYHRIGTQWFDENNQEVTN